MSNLIYYYIQKEIYNKYKKDIQFIASSTEVPYCYLKEKIIYYPLKKFIQPTARSVFDLIHEVGHIQTNTSNMKRCEEEFYATQWAINVFKQYNGSLNIHDKNDYQIYIWKWRETGLKHNGNRIPSKEQLTLQW